MQLKEIAWIRRVAYIVRNFRNKHSYTSGRNNRIRNTGGIRVGSRIQISGNGNVVVIENNALLLNSLIHIIGDNNRVVLKSKSYVSGAELWVENNQCSLIVGERTFIGNKSHLACTEDGIRLVIGDDCMISSSVQIRTGDSHSILDMEGKRINPAHSVKIGNHCWLGQGCRILKGGELGENVIVSTGAIVTKVFGDNVLVGGIPAQVLRENVTWESRRI